MVILGFVVDDVVDIVVVVVVVDVVVWGVGVFGLDVGLGVGVLGVFNGFVVFIVVENEVGLDVDVDVDVEIVFDVDDVNGVCLDVIVYLVLFELELVLNVVI